MARYFKNRIENKGLPPGSLVFIGQKKVEKVHIELVSFNKEDLNSFNYGSLEEVPAASENHINWYNIFGLDDVDFMKSLRERLEIHPLIMEDVMNTGQRAKFEEFDSSVFVSLKMLQFDESSMKVLSEQVSFILFEKGLICFQEAPGDVFDPIRKRLQNKLGNLRKSNTDYLLYVLIDSIVDNYIYLIESLGESIDNLELEVLDNPDESILQKINSYKKELHFIQKIIKPVRELMSNLLKSNSHLLQDKKIKPFFKDLNDLVIHAIESVDTYRLILTDYFQLYHSAMSAKMNDIMKVLTIFSAIFIPLSFFAGVYGTNFEHFPELKFKYAYPVFWLFILGITGTMLVYFKRKKWF